VRNWVDIEAEASQVQAEDQRRRSELGLHVARVAEAKFPDFFVATMRCVTNDCDKLHAKYPFDPARKCAVKNDGGIWTLQGCKIPWRILHFRLNTIAVAVGVHLQDLVIRSV
jgi:hypothetical protein